MFMIDKAEPVSVKSSSRSTKHLAALDLTDFENCVELGNSHCSQLLSASQHKGALEMDGPMNREQAIHFFYRYRGNVFPLFIVEAKNGYFAFY